MRHLVTVGAAALVATATATPVSAAAPSTLLPPASFAKAVKTPGTVTIDVHVPDAGSIRGTDLSIPFDRIGDSKARLPARSTRLAVYCRSGTMSAIAVLTLRKLGFTRLRRAAGRHERLEADGPRAGAAETGVAT